MQATIQTVASVDQLNLVSAEWDALAASCPQRHFNQTTVYAKVAIERALLRKSTVSLVLAHNAGDLVGVWPLVVRREGLIRVARPISCGSNEEYTDPLVAPSAEHGALQAIMLKALDLPCDVLWLMNVKAQTLLADLFDREPLASLPKEALAMTGYAMNVSRFSSWEDYRAQSPSRAASLARKLRNLERLGDVSFGWCRSPRDSAGVVDWMFAAKRAWIRRRRLYSPWLTKDNVPAFFVALAKSVDLTNDPLFAYLKLDGVPIAAQINLVGGAALESFMVAQDAKYDKYSPGELLTEYCTHLAIDRKLDFDFRIMSDHYKCKRSDIKSHYTSYQIYTSVFGRLIGPTQISFEKIRASLFRKSMRIKALARNLADSSMLRTWITRSDSGSA